jgi:hypothetical protein
LATSEKAEAPAAPQDHARGIGPLALALAVLAGLAWSGALTLLFFTDVDRARDMLAPGRLIYCGLALAAGLLTFLPIQARLHLPGLAREGAAGTFALLYTLAFVPPPNSWLLSPPDAPVYVVLGAALFWFTSAAAQPIIFTVGRRIFRQRARQYDLRRARRQSHEVGAVVVGWLLLAGLRVLTPIGALLVVLIALVAEFMLLSYIEAEA